MQRIATATITLIGITTLSRARSQLACALLPANRELVLATDEASKCRIQKQDKYFTKLAIDLNSMQPRRDATVGCAFRNLRLAGG